MYIKKNKNKKNVHQKFSLTSLSSLLFYLFHLLFRLKTLDRSIDFFCVVSMSSCCFCCSCCIFIWIFFCVAPLCGGKDLFILLKRKKKKLEKSQEAAPNIHDKVTKTFGDEKGFMRGRMSVFKIIIMETKQRLIVMKYFKKRVRHYNWIKLVIIVMSQI